MRNPDRTPKTNCPALREILVYLVEQHKVPLGIISTSSAAVARHLSEVTSLSKTTLSKYIDGNELKSTVRKYTLEELAKYFSGVVRGISWNWFCVDTLEEFIRLGVEELSGAGLFPVYLRVPSSVEQVTRARALVCGLYVAYRYPFEGLSIDNVSREVLRISPNGNGFHFQMSSLNPASAALSDVSTYDGVCLPIGRSLLCLGFNESTSQARTLFMDEELTAEDVADVKLGILTSTRIDGNQSPAAACTVLIRVNWDVRDIESFIRDVTMVGDFDAVISGDFGPDETNRTAMRVFLDNRPSGSLKDKEEHGLRRYEFSGKPREPVLRVYTERFKNVMPVILKNALVDESVFAPFKANWLKRRVSE